MFNKLIAAGSMVLWCTAGHTRSCPEPPTWISSSATSDTCTFTFTQKDQFNPASLVEFIDLLSHDAGKAIMRVRIPAGQYIFNRPISVTGANGWKLQIVGDGAADTKLVFANSHGVSLEGPYAIGLIDKLTLNGDGQRGIRNDSLLDKQGVLARRGANIKLGRDVIVEEFSRVGVLAYMSSTIYAAGVISRNNGSDGFAASYNSTIYARKSVSSGNRGDGYFSEAASSIAAEESTSMRNVVDRTQGGTRGGDGYVAILGAVINAHSATLDSNEDQDFVVTGTSVIDARGVATKEKLKSQVRDNGTLILR